MDLSSWLVTLNRVGSAYLILAALVALVVLAGGLYGVGFLGRVLWLVDVVLTTSTAAGFRLWKRLLSWADWRLFVVMVFALVTVGRVLGELLPALEVLFGATLLFLGVVTCLACMHIDLERYQVARGYKALHNPLKGQELALNLVQYGHQVGVLLLIAATLGMIGGFALMNGGLYETVGRDWYTLGQGKGAPTFLDFLAYTLINLFRVVDLLDLVNSYNHDHVLVTYVRQAKWPASTLLAVFKIFFSVVLLQQIFTAVRQGRLLAETINDFWSPHPPIHDRAASSLPQHGPGAVWSLLHSLRSIEVMTAEQRAHLPPIIAGIGPAAVPILVQHLNDPSENVRAVAASALGYLHALDTVPALVLLSQDASPWVRQSLAGALGIIGESRVPSARKRRPLPGAVHSPGRWLGEIIRWRRPPSRAPQVDPVAEAVATLRFALTDPMAAVREEAARSLGLIGVDAASAAPDLIDLLHSADESLRCQAAEALGNVGGQTEEGVAALVELLSDPSPALRTAAAHALGALKKDAESAVPALMSLLQERSETVRQAAAEAIGRIGVVQQETVPVLTEGLASPDALVQAQTAEVLGTIGPAAVEATPALAEALENGSERVRAKAAHALGQIGEGAAVAVPHLVRALRGKDSWISALAAEALGEIGDASAGAIPALIRSLRHSNPQVRANAAEALGKLGDAARSALPALEQATRDEDGEVCSHALIALGEIGPLTEAGGQTLLAALADPDPQVRAATVEAIGKRPELKEAGSAALVRALADASDPVQLAVTKALSRLAAATPAVIDGLCRLLEDDNVSVQAHAALALGQLGPSAQAAGEALLRAARIGEADLREQALRALAQIQPPEALPAFVAGLKDAQPAIRKIASAGLLKTADIPADAWPSLVEALRDPEVQIRANSAGALARLESLPADAIPFLIESATDADEGLRSNAALALRLAPPSAARDTFRHLLTDSNPRLRLLAAGSLLDADPEDAEAVAVLDRALADPAFRLRKAALERIDALGPRGSVLLESLRRRVDPELHPELSGLLAEIIERLEQQQAEEKKPAGEAPADEAQPSTISTTG